MFTSVILIVHIIVCIALVLIILLQSGKGADIGAAFGGGSSQTVFGSTGATTFLGRVTVGAAVLFMCTSIVLTYFSGRAAQPVEHSVMSGKTAPQAPGTIPALPPTEPQPEQAAPAAGAPATPPTEAPATPAPAPSVPAPAPTAPDAAPAEQK